MRISIDGNIGSGKSTVLDALERSFPDIAVYREPVDSWSRLLELYYKDPHRWSLALNLQVLSDFQTARYAPAPLFVERSPLSCRHVFAQVQHNDETLNKTQWELFKDYYDVLGWQPDAIIYINTPPEVCMERVAHRGRPCERNVNVQYLKLINFLYEKMLGYLTIPVIMVDGTKDPALVAADVMCAVERLLNPPPEEKNTS